MQQQPPTGTPAGAAPATATGAGADGAAAASASASAAAPPTRLFFGSLEATLRAQGASAATAAQSSAPAAAAAASAAAAATATAPKVPVSFNNRTALLSHSASDAAAVAAPKQLSDAVRLGMAAGNINVSGVSADTFALSAATQQAKAAQDAYLREMEIAKKARSVVVPTNDNLVRKRLREIGEPITLFGERVSAHTHTHAGRHTSTPASTHSHLSIPPSSNPFL